MSKAIKLAPGDVHVQPIARDQCEKCFTNDATHLVALDIRNAGQETTIGEYCRPCARLVATAIRQSLK